MKDSCQRFKQMVSGYIEGELDHPNRNLMEKHLRVCLECKSKISQLKKLIKNLQQLPKISVSPNFETILRARISMESSLARHRRERFFPFRSVPLPVYALAAIVLLVALSTLFLLNKSNRFSTPQANTNVEWFQGGIQKVDPVTNEHYIYIIETQPIPNMRSQVNEDSIPQEEKNIRSDSSKVMKNNKSWYETVRVLESKIF